MAQNSGAGLYTQFVGDLPLTAEESPTEGLHPDSAQISSAEACWDHFESQESRICAALSRCRSEALEAAQWWAQTLSGEGRIIGLGAGTSGRLIALEMAEWGPTFSISEERRVALLAGGSAALTRAIEGAEDDGSAGRKAVSAEKVGHTDLVLGVSASGAAKYVREGLVEADARGARTILITGNPDLNMPLKGQHLRVLLDTGSETVAGSTRLGAATATHRLLHRISTMGAQSLDWIFRGRMVRMQVTNAKLRRRAVTIVSELTQLSESRSQALISDSDNDLCVAVAAGWLGSSNIFAREALIAVNGRLSVLEGHLEPLRSGQVSPEELAVRLGKP
ncbi:MAG: hypothetical protein CBC13_10055 [Planctomycetia bacterium TMED53]|nr:MAG: hypothetical protein CBC13_10055 [Planctomycetia bacterium TMED53]